MLIDDFSSRLSRPLCLPAFACPSCFVLECAYVRSSPIDDWMDYEIRFNFPPSLWDTLRISINPGALIYGLHLRSMSLQNIISDIVLCDISPEYKLMGICRKNNKNQVLKETLRIQTPHKRLQVRQIFPPSTGIIKTTITAQITAP